MSVKFNLGLNLYNCSILCADLCLPNIFVWATGLEPVTYGLTATIPLTKKSAVIRRKLGLFIVCCCVKMESSMQICTFLDWSKIAFNSTKNSTLYTFSRNDIV